MLPEYEKRKEQIIRPLHEKLLLTPVQVSSVCTDAEQEASAEIQRQGTSRLHVGEIYEKTLEVLDKKVRKMVEKWDAGDDLPDILKSAHRGTLK